MTVPIPERTSLTVIMCGDSGVGKTALVREFVSDICPPTFQGKTEITRAWRSIDVGHVLAEITIWDAPGLPTFRPVIRAHCGHCDGALLVYDITNHETFESLPGWVDLIRGAARPNAPIILVGNKSDHKGPKPVTSDEGERFARANTLMFTEVSAQTGMYVTAAFKKLVMKILEQGVQ
jgi:small GTP-binding protein